MIFEKKLSFPDQMAYTEKEIDVEKAMIWKVQSKYISCRDYIICIFICSDVLIFTHTEQRKNYKKTVQSRNLGFLLFFPFPSIHSFKIGLVVVFTCIQSLTHTHVPVLSLVRPPAKRSHVTYISSSQIEIFSFFHLSLFIHVLISIQCNWL